MASATHGVRRLATLAAVAVLVTPALACSGHAAPPPSFPVAVTSTGGGSPSTTPDTVVGMAGVMRRIAYGPADQQFGELWMPPGSTDPSALQPAAMPVVVLVHGGFWYSNYGLELMNGLALDLSQRGFAVWNIEYRRIGDTGGGWPGTLDDAAAAVDALVSIAEDEPLDLATVTVIGHSAGGQLALWIAGRARLVAGEPGAQPKVKPRTAIGLGPVTALASAADDHLGTDAAVLLLGGTPAQVPQRYAVATPVPSAGVRMIVVRATDDGIVDAKYTLPTPLGDTIVIDVPDENHFQLIDSRSDSWAAVLGVLDRPVDG